ncbi:unnamed protein product [Trichogramma brassicae]|uniref:Integrase catalytic domain-containing protein n=1 Tax=Trichogramma brassicae TaxID=86971 RepID=A0A6H5IF21_9HYME|nr:unnamed protein product [Trichogramma brassicae]
MSPPTYSSLLAGRRRAEREATLDPPHSQRPADGPTPTHHRDAITNTCFTLGPVHRTAKSNSTAHFFHRDRQVNVRLVEVDTCNTRALTSREPDAMLDYGERVGKTKRGCESKLGREHRGHTATSPIYHDLRGHERNTSTVWTRGTTQSHGYDFRDFYWPNLIKQYQRYLKHVIHANAIRCCTQPINGPTQPMLPTRPNELLSIDFIGPFPAGIRDYRYVLVTVDVFYKKLTQLYPIVNATCHITFNRIVDDYFKRFGKVEKIQSDRGSQFTNVKDLASRNEKSRCPGNLFSDTTSQSNIVERYNKEIGRFFTHAGRTKSPNMVSLVNMSTTKSSVRVTIECVDSCEILIVPPTSRRRRHDHGRRSNDDDLRDQCQTSKDPPMNQEVLAAARQVSIDEVKQPRLAALAKLPSMVEQQREIIRRPWRMGKSPPPTITLSDDYSLVSETSLTEYIVNDIKQRVAAELRRQRRRRAHTNKCSKTRRGSSCNVRPGLSNSLKSSSRTAESHRVGKLFKFIRTPARQAIRALRRDAYNEYSCRSSHFYACARKQELNTLQYTGIERRNGKKEKKKEKKSKERKKERWRPAREKKSSILRTRVHAHAHFSDAQYVGLVKRTTEEAKHARSSSSSSWRHKSACVSQRECLCAAAAAAITSTATAATAATTTTSALLQRDQESTNESVVRRGMRFTHNLKVRDSRKLPSLSLWYRYIPCISVHECAPAISAPASTKNKHHKISRRESVREPEGERKRKKSEPNKIEKSINCRDVDVVTVKIRYRCPDQRSSRSDEKIYPIQRFACVEEMEEYWRVRWAFSARCNSDDRHISRMN